MSILAFPSTSITDSTATGRSLVTAANAAAAATAAGVGTGDSPQFTAVNVGHASDTTITRSAAGVIAVEGVDVPLNSTSATHTAGTIELGAASDTTLSRSSAGVLAVEGVTVSLNSTSATHTAGTIELGAASDTTLSRSSAGVIAVEGVTVSLNSTSATHTAGTIELGAATDTTISRLGAGTIGVEGNPTLLYLGHSCVETDQSTTSATATDLATAMSVTFTAPANGTIWVFGEAESYNSAAGNNNTIWVDLDGSDTLLRSVTAPVANYQVSMSRGIAIAVTSGSRTVKLQFSRSGGTANFLRRSLIVYWIQ